jgi:hypothetical protein
MQKPRMLTMERDGVKEGAIFSNQFHMTHEAIY